METVNNNANTNSFSTDGTVQMETLFYPALIKGEKGDTGNVNVRKTYHSVYSMNSDKTSPIATDGTSIKIGDIVIVSNTSTPSENSLYTYEGATAGWRFHSALNFALAQEMGSNPNVAISQKVVSSKINNVQGDLYYFTGYINKITGELTESNLETSLYKTTDFLLINKEKITISRAIVGGTAAGAPAVAFYDKDKTYIGYHPTESGIIDNLIVEVDAIPANATYIRTCSYKIHYPSIEGIYGSHNRKINELQTIIGSNVQYVTEEANIECQWGHIESNGNLGGENARIRIRTKSYNLKQGQTVTITNNSGFISANNAFFLNDVLVKVVDQIPSKIVYDGSLNNFRLAFKKTDGSAFSDIDLITIQQNLIISYRSEVYDRNCLLDRIYNLEETNEQQQNSINDILKNPFSGLKLAALGDSITYGFIPRNAPGYPGQLDSYAKLTATKLGMTFTNQGISGSTVGDNGTGGNSPMSKRYQNLPNDADVIIFMGGTNDVRKSVPLGKMTDRVNTTFYGALHVTMQGLYKKYMIDQGTEVAKCKKIIVCTPIKLLQSSSSTLGGAGTLLSWDEWINAIKEVAAYYSFPVLDFYNLSSINPHLNQTIKGTETGYTGYYNPYITDGTHPTQDGAEIMSKLLTDFLLSTNK